MKYSRFFFQLGSQSHPRKETEAKEGFDYCSDEVGWKTQEELQKSRSNRLFWDVLINRRVAMYLEDHPI